MSSSTSAVFTGSSTYSNDFAQVITRAQQIASLPITLLTNEKDTLTSQQTALGTLGSSFTSLQASLLSMDSSMSSGNYGVTYSNSAVASATASAGALPGNYTLQVVDPGSLGSATSAITGAGTVTDPTKSSISSAFSFSLTANGQQYNNIVPAANTLSSLADAINTATSGAVQATVVNMGSTSAPSYQLSLQNSKYGALPITLSDAMGGANLLTNATAGTSVQYRVNGQPATGDPLSADTRTLTIAPNVSVSVLAAGTTSITVAHSSAGIAGKIASFVAAYNTAATSLDGQIGSGAGALGGQSVISSLSQSLRNLTTYTGTGSLTSIADLGLTFDKSGVLSFDPTVLSAAAAKDFQGVADFLGSSTGGGFLQAANNVMNTVTDQTTGIIPTSVLSVANEITDTTTQISNNQSRVDLLTQSLNAQMAAADALIASLQQQATYFTNMFAAMSSNQSSMK